MTVAGQGSGTTAIAGGVVRRTTRQRTAVDDALASLEEFVSAQRLHEILRARGENVGLATVYRTLQVLVEDGAVDVLRSDEGEALYRRCAQTEHHHHLVCRECRATVEIDGPEIEAWAAALAKRHGFVDVDHTLELMGLCSDCARGGGDGR